ncbi:hydroxymethylglutaryl-CoA reductase, degradative [Streptococcus catagoni]|uniref:hydroxymethylglutaryl-CoA reductase, degradative n=1 Tax=Streptococcus catagoni TaxID=2654874 RepID=UPI001F3F226C|nr:hydroxymethylglutaryl-CoA reductase, degradative [Streptococcus catagoni]
MTNNKLNWSGFYKKSLEQRLEMIRDFNLLNEDKLKSLQNQDLLTADTANQMVENTIGRFALPFSIVPDFEVNDRVYQLPFVTEEPSVVAAASYAAKIVKSSGGFKTKVIGRQMIGQVALYDLENKEIAKKRILENQESLIKLANDSYPSIVKRGGGAREIRVEIKDQFLIVYLTVDTQEAMGANMVNTMMEALVPSLEEETKGKSLMAILSNYATESLVSSECSIDFRYLSRDPKQALILAQKMELASRLAQIDSYRAATHNKGIFNGIDAIVLATGNDWRAIEAAGHAFASKDGSYKGLTEWTCDLENKLVRGTLIMPMPIATKGGSIGLNPSVSIAHDLLKYPEAKELAQIIVSVGLAQNFAALKALTNTGIQAGHMKLQAKSLALLAGASEANLTKLLPLLLKEKHMNLETAQKLLKKLEDSK